jgi:hypothetical protein
MRKRHALGGLLLACSLVLAAVVPSGGCGYALAGRGSFLPDYINTIGVPAFTNLTPYEIEQAFTAKVRSEFIGRGKYKILPQNAGVDAVLTGEIVSLTIVPAAFTDQNQASRYFVNVVARMEFKDLKTNNVLWENPSLVFREEYEATPGSDALDPNAFFGQETNALERITTEFARTVVSSILEAF